MGNVVVDRVKGFRGMHEITFLLLKRGMTPTFVKIVVTIVTLREPPFYSLAAIRVCRV